MRVRGDTLLLAGREFDGRYYLVDYAVEAAIKACIAKAIKKNPRQGKVKATKSRSPFAKGSRRDKCFNR
jgi:hypothetical protein